MDHFHGNTHKPSIFLVFEGEQIKNRHGLSTICIIIYSTNLLTNLAYSSHTGEYWPSIVFAC